MRNGAFLKQTLKPTTNYIVQDFLIPDRFALWASPPGEGKSILAEALIYSVAYGAPFIGKKVAGGNIMVIDSENRKDILVERISKIKQALENEGYKKQGEIEIQHYSGFLLDDKSTWAPVEKEIKTLEPSVILIDHLACFHHQDENRENNMKIVTTAIEELMAIKGSSVVVLHHFNKYDTGNFFKRLRGSSALYAKCDVACEVRALSHSDGKLEKTGIIFQPRKDITPAPIRVKIEEGDNWMKLVYDGTYKPVDDPRLDDLAHKFYHEFLDPVDTDEITVKKMIKIVKSYATDTEVRLCLRFLEHNKGLISSERRGLGGGFHYSLNIPPGVKSLVCPWCNQTVMV